MRFGMTPARTRAVFQWTLLKLGRRKHKAAREHGMHALQHFYASVLLDAGENIKALIEYLGHHDPGFTLRTYTHLMPSSQDRTRNAVTAVFASGPKL
ncbi:hypothetical protein ACIA8R_23650 [Nonomuraea sp. NPDC051191]|uniref:hypothetical protein n=1 Tax=Nonomuraea sp. NPDC051191 TaxID=3364372 RepID=UPI0037B71215